MKVFKFMLFLKKIVKFVLLMYLYEKIYEKGFLYFVLFCEKLILNLWIVYFEIGKMGKS